MLKLKTIGVLLITIGIISEIALFFLVMFVPDFTLPTIETEPSGLFDYLVATGFFYVYTPIFLILIGILILIYNHIRKT